jgi:hypothetical protein
MALISGTAILGTLGTIVLLEGIMAVADHMAGDPEADVQAALQRLAAQNQRRAFSMAAGEQLGAEEVERKFARFNTIPRRALTQAAMMGGPGALETRAGVTPDTGLLDFVSTRLGVPPDQLMKASASRKMGDLSNALRSVGKPPVP